MSNVLNIISGILLGMPCSMLWGIPCMAGACALVRFICSEEGKEEELEKTYCVTNSVKAIWLVAFIMAGAVIYLKFPGNGAVFLPAAFFWMISCLLLGFHSFTDFRSRLIYRSFAILSILNAVFFSLSWHIAAGDGISHMAVPAIFAIAYIFAGKFLFGFGDGLVLAACVFLAEPFIGMGAFGTVVYTLLHISLAILLFLLTHIKMFSLRQFRMRERIAFCPSIAVALAAIVLAGGFLPVL